VETLSAFPAEWGFFPLLSLVVSYHVMIFLFLFRRTTAKASSPPKTTLANNSSVVLKMESEAAKG
jgi:hypothetical protein